MELTAEITKAYTTFGTSTIEFSVWDGEATQMVSFESKIDLVHASFLTEHTPLGTDDSAYAQMLRAFCEAESLNSLVGRTFTSGQEPESLCEQGVHSWSNEVGLLHPDTKCDHCNETYGNPA